MRHKLLHENSGQRTYAVILDSGEEVMDCLSPAHLRKRKDPESGLALIRLDV